MSDPVKVMIVEDSSAYRSVVKLALDAKEEVDLIEEFGTAEIALRRFAYDNLPSPDVILLDLQLPGMSGLDALPHFLNYSPKTKIMILTQSDREADILRGITLGASGYLLKSASVDEILKGILSVAAGRASLDTKVAKFLMDDLKQRIPARQHSIELSNREVEILGLLSEGFVKKEIAAELSIGYSTVDTHVGHIYGKLQVKNAPAAVNKAHRLGLIK